MSSTNKKSMIKMMLISLAPIIAFIYVDEYYGPKAGVIAGISLGVLETLFLYLTEKRLDKFSLGSTLLILIMGSLSLLTGNQLFFKLKPAIVNIVMVMIVLGSSFMKKPIMLLFAKKQFGENFTPNPYMLSYFSGISYRLTFLLIFHTVLIVYSALYMSNAAWGFITKGGSFILMGIYLVIEFFYAKFIMPRKFSKTQDKIQEKKLEKILNKRKQTHLS
jgi:intracellular septation protein A